ncbi:Uncharacterized RNA pseudouridine synthase YlyB (RNA pseudouridylate synthase) (RNA-uridine isomerase), partial [Durusdinium trenchii]
SSQQLESSSVAFNAAISACRRSWTQGLYLLQTKRLLALDLQGMNFGSVVSAMKGSSQWQRAGQLLAEIWHIWGTDRLQGPLGALEGVEVLASAPGLIAVFKPSGVSTEEILGPLPVAAVSRLDKPTSGVLVAALGDESAFHLASAQFAAQSVKKEYICLCHGFLGPPGGQGRTKQALRRSSRGPMEVAKGDGQDAETVYEVLEVFKGPYTLLKVIPKTGRRHQLRVHLASMGRPIVGDLLYGSARENDCGLFLHCQCVALQDAAGGDFVVEAPLPAELCKILEGLRESQMSGSDPGAEL